MSVAGNGSGGKAGERQLVRMMSWGGGKRKHREPALGQVGTQREGDLCWVDELCGRGWGMCNVLRLPALSCAMSFLLHHFLKTGLALQISGASHVCHFGMCDREAGFKEA